MYGKVARETEIEMFARIFSELSDIDKRKIMNLIDFKRKYKESLHG